MDNSNVLNYFRQPVPTGTDPAPKNNVLVLGGTVVGKAGTQAAAIADISTVSGEMSTTERQAFNAVLAVLRDIGAISSHIPA